MSYRKVDWLPRAERTYWSPERGGRLWSYVGEKRVKKFSFSPYTAKAGKEYTFYADIQLSQEIESPQGSGKMRRFTTMEAFRGTFKEFKEALESGEVMEILDLKLMEIGGGEAMSIGYWRGRAHEVALGER